MMSHDGKRTVDLFGLRIDALSLHDAADEIVREVVTARSMKYVVTPNIDHIVMLRSDEKFRECYRHASFTFADGWPVVLASRLTGQSIPERVAGSDLVPAILSSAQRSAAPLKVFVLGGMNDVPERAANWIRREYTGVEVVGSYSPPYGFEKDLLESKNVVDLVASSNANFLVVGLGAPKQEKWILQNRHLLPAGVAICAGATVDFMAGSVKRAPAWMKNLGLEWLHRLLSDPKRLFKRYARDAFVFPIIMISEMFKRRAAKKGHHES